MDRSQNHEPRQLLPVILDYRARSEPDRVWAKYPVSSTSYSKGFKAVTYGQMCNAVNRLAWVLVETIGSSTHFDTLAYLGPGDLRYHIFILAAIKAGYKAFLPSPRNSPVAQKDLLSRLNCRVLATTDPEPPFVSSLLHEYPTLTIVRVPSLDVLLQGDQVPSYPYNKSFEIARDDPIFVLHTSGSTGIPKPMIYTNEFVWRMFKANTLPALEGMTRIDDNFLRGEFFSFLPAFHIAGIGWGLVLPMFANSIPVLPLPGRPPSTDAFLEAVKYGTFDWAFLLPVIIDELSKDLGALEMVASRLQYLFYTGGALPEEAGKIVSSKIAIFSGLGSSEYAALPQVQVPNAVLADTWRYVNIHPAAGSDFRNHMDELFELVIVKSTQRPEVQPVFAMFPNLDEYETRDLFSPHPTIPGFWRHRGRRDDIVVFLNGEKTNPTSFEDEVSRHPAVQAALVVGNQRFEACLLIEPAAADTGWTNRAKTDLIENIWPTVEEANRHCPAHARVWKSRILVLDPSKPMLRAGKGTVQRQGTLRLYSEEIDALYSETNMQQATESQVFVSISSLETAVSSLRTIVANITAWSQFDDDTDFFTLAMDSLQVLRLSTIIRSSLGIHAISPAIIYRNPSVNLLAKELYHLEGKIGDIENERVSAMANLLKHYEQEINQIVSNKLLNPVVTELPKSEVVLLTGSTGTVGSFLLNQLLGNKKISHIYCLNRSDDSGSLQSSRNQQRGIPCGFPPDRVTFLTVDLTKGCFGLDTSTYTTISENTTQIIHNAWPVDFNQPLQFFQPSLDGLLALITFAYQAKLRPSLLFLSSISAVSSYAQVGSSLLIPEEIISNLNCPASMGYGESKYLAERMIGHASTALSIRCGVSRIGQVTGTARDPRGWKRAEWLPSLILSSRHLRALPDSLGGGVMDFIDWVPVDELASILVELNFELASTALATTGPQVFNCVNPHTIAWSDLVPVITTELEVSLNPNSGETRVTTIGFREWLDRLQGSAAGLTQNESVSAELTENPAVKLLEFYSQLTIDNHGGPSMRFSSDKTVRVSKTLRELQPIQNEWMRGWIRDWLKQ